MTYGTFTYMPTAMFLVLRNLTTDMKLGKHNPKFKQRFLTLRIINIK